MSIEINLEQAILERAKAAAELLGISLDEYLRRLLEQALPPPKPRTGAELVAALKRAGVIGAWADRTDIKDSSEYARELRRNAEKRQHD